MQREQLRCPLAQGPAGNHASPDDVAAFLHRDLFETKTALLERHIWQCVKNALYLMCSP